jgi:hypothetical protein
MPGRQVGRQAGELAAGARIQRHLESLVELGWRQAAIAGCDPEHLDHPVPVRMGSPELASGAQLTWIAHRGNLASHGT